MHMCFFSLCIMFDDVPRNKVVSWPSSDGREQTSLFMEGEESPVNLLQILLTQKATDSRISGDHNTGLHKGHTGLGIIQKAIDGLIKRAHLIYLLPQVPG